MFALLIIKVLFILVMVTRLFLCEKDYDIAIKRFDPVLEENDIIEWNDVKIVSYNRTLKILKGDLVIKQDIDQTHTLEMAGYEWYRVEYRLSGVNLPITNLCKFLEKDTMFFKDLIESCNLPQTCPIVAGEYKCDNFYLNQENMPDNFPGDKWKFEIKVRDPQSTVLTAMNLYLDVDHNKGIKNE